jgi:hypothetical protein
LEYLQKWRITFRVFLTFGEPNRGEPNVPLWVWRLRQTQKSEGVQPERGPGSDRRERRSRNTLLGEVILLPATGSEPRTASGQLLCFHSFLFNFFYFVFLSAEGGILSFFNFSRQTNFFFIIFLLY